MVNYACAFSQSETDKHFEWIKVRFNYFYDSKHALDMVAFKSPERESKGLLIIVRERTKHVSGINLLRTTLKK